MLFLLHANKKADFRQGRTLAARVHELEWHKPQRTPVWMTEQAYAELPGYHGSRI